MEFSLTSRHDNLEKALGVLEKRAKDKGYYKISEVTREVLEGPMYKFTVTASEG